VKGNVPVRRELIQNMERSGSFEKCRPAGLFNFRKLSN